MPLKRLKYIKNAYLYWDQVRRRTNETVIALIDKGVFIPIGGGGRAAFLNRRTIEREATWKP